MELSRHIKLASWLGKTATSQRGRRLAYQVKAAKVSVGLVRFGRLFRVLWVEQHPSLGALTTVRLADKSMVHMPWQHFSPEAQARYPLDSLHRRVAPAAFRPGPLPQAKTASERWAA